MCTNPGVYFVFDKRVLNKCRWPKFEPVCLGSFPPRANSQTSNSPIPLSGNTSQKLENWFNKHIQHKSTMNKNASIDGGDILDKKRTD